MKNSESKGTKSSNIYQVLKGSGAWQSKDSAGPMIKGVGIKSPLNMKSPNKLMPSDSQAVKDKQQQKKNAETRKSGKAVSYKDAYADADKKKYDTYEKFEKAAKDYNKKKYETENPTSESKKQKISKEQLAKNVAEKNKKKVDDNKVDKKKVDVVNKEKENLDKVVQTNKQKRVANRKQKKADRIKKRADRVAKTGGSKIGNALRGAKQLAKNVVKGKKEDNSALAMKKSPAKMMGPGLGQKKGKKKKSPNKMNPGFDKLPADVQAKIKKNKK